MPVSSKPVSIQTGAPYQAAVESGEVILTFDDGPDDDSLQPPSVLYSILTTLKKHDVKSVFYVLGNGVKKYPEGAKRIVDDGHFIQSHSWDHTHLVLKSREDLEDNLRKTQDVISATTGIQPNRIRPPYGTGYHKSILLREVCSSLSLTLMRWDVDTRDWKHGGLKKSLFDPTMDRWLAEYKKSPRDSWKHDVHSRDIQPLPLDILMHVRTGTSRDLEAFIVNLKNRGWRFTTYPGDKPQSLF